MGVTFFEEVLFSDEHINLKNLYGKAEYLSRENSLFIYSEENFSNSEEQKISIIKNNETMDGFFLHNYNLNSFIINNKNYKTDKKAKLILLEKNQELNLDIILNETNQNQKKIGTLIILKKIGILTSLPVYFSYKIKTIGNVFRKSKGGALKVIHGIKGEYVLKFTGLSNEDITLLKKLYTYKKHFYMSIFPERDDIEEAGLKVEDFHPLIITGDFYPKLRDNLLGIGQDIKIKLEQI